MMLYEELFKWILHRIGLHFKCPVHTGVISILDNYGFEKYNNNGVEEFLINSVNERIENLFVKHCFHDQLVDYAKDGITVEYKVPASIENGKAVELLFKKPYGLLPLLTDECKFPKGTHETYLEHCNLNHTDRSCYGKVGSYYSIRRLEMCRFRQEIRKEWSSEWNIALEQLGTMSTTSSLETNEWYH